MSILRDLENKHKVISEAYEVVATYEFQLQGMGAPPLKVKILKDHECHFTPSMSHYLQVSGAAGPYAPSFDPRASIKEALRDVFTDGLRSYDPKDEDATWGVNKFF